jgi:predicted nucleic acid-binding protein
MVAAVCSWHTHHEATVAEISRRLSKGEEPVMAAPALVEAYAVLTRLPAPHRLLPTDALALLEANFIARRQVVALDGRAYTDLLHGAPELGIEGGRTYDAVIAHCAIRARAADLLTWNEEDFRAWDGKPFQVIVPTC